MTRPVMVVTGANSGIGRCIATDLARKNAHVVLVCRNEQRGLEARDAIRKATGNQEVELALCDVGSQASVRQFAEDFRHERVDVLVNNAGVYMPARQLTADGFESMLAINHLGAFLLTALLRERLAAAKAPRVVTVSSVAHLFGTVDWRNLQCERAFTPMRQYGSTKLMNILFTRELARRGEADGLVANCFHPGAVSTGFAQDEPGFLNNLMQVGRVFLRTPQKGAETGTYLAQDPAAAAVTGAYFVDRKPRRTSRKARDAALAKRLWEVSEELTGLR